MTRCVMRAGASPSAATRCVIFVIAQLTHEHDALRHARKPTGARRHGASFLLVCIALPRDRPSPPPPEATRCVIFVIVQLMGAREATRCVIFVSVQPPLAGGAGTHPHTHTRHRDELRRISPPLNRRLQGDKTIKEKIREFSSTPHKYYLYTGGAGRTSIHIHIHTAPRRTETASTGSLSKGDNGANYIFLLHRADRKCHRHGGDGHGQGKENRSFGAGVNQG